MLTGSALIDDMNSCSLADGRMCLWWLGQLSYAVKIDGTMLYFDPYLTDEPRRAVPPLLKPSEVVNAHLVFGSHDHADHIDRPAWPAIAEASPRARFVVPELVLDDVARETGIPRERFVPMDDGRRVEIDGLIVTAIAAAHEFLDRDEKTGLYPYLGYVVEGGSRVVYHSGDTCLYLGLVNKLTRWERFDAMMIPINGRDARRLRAGIIGCMTYQEAADLAGLLSPRVTLPGHYDMFENNSLDPKLFIDYMHAKHPDEDVRLCEHGKRLTI
jgi:L-ascorbate metabolism protein UlaG (beta-lactamase superfamily)